MKKKKQRTTLMFGFMQKILNDFNSAKARGEEMLPWEFESLKLKTSMIKKALMPVCYKVFAEKWKSKIFFQERGGELIPVEEPKTNDIDRYLAEEFGISQHTLSAWRYDKSRDCPEVYKRYLGLLNILMEVFERKEYVLLHETVLKKMLVDAKISGREEAVKLKTVENREVEGAKL